MGIVIETRCWTPMFVYLVLPGDESNVPFGEGHSRNQLINHSS